MAKQFATFGISISLLIIGAPAKGLALTSAGIRLGAGNANKTVIELTRPGDPSAHCADQTQTELSACVATQEAAAEQKLNAAYRVLMGKLSASDQSRLRVAERGWIAWREKECLMRTGGDLGGGGTIAPMLISECQRDLARVRTSFLEELIKAPQGVTVGAESDVSSSGMLKELRRSFTVRGKSVPPEIFRDMGDGHLADTEAIIVTVDVAAAVRSNLYADNPIREEGGWRHQGNDQGESGYRYLGTTQNGRLIVITRYNGGGSGWFYALHVLDASAGRAFDLDGKPYLRLNVTTLRSIVLGDRWDGEVTIGGNVLHIRSKSNAAPGETSLSRDVDVDEP